MLKEGASSKFEKFLYLKDLYFHALLDSFYGFFSGIVLHFVCLKLAFNTEDRLQRQFSCGLRKEER
jgi:hypothetical protein